MDRDRLDVSEMSEVWAAIDELRTSMMAGFTSITRGSLRVASEDGLIVEGTALITGLLRVIGRVLVQGLGILEVSSLIDLTGMLRVLGEILVPDGGKITVGDIRIEGGKIYVGEGSNQIVIDGASGTITVGDIRIEGGKIYVGEGSNQIVIDGASGTIIAGSMVITPDDGGSLTAPARIAINTPLTDLKGALSVAQGAVFEGTITASGLLPSPIAGAPSGAFLGAVYRDGSNRLRVVVP
ncbi:hypothetical protein [Microbacterium sp. MMO-70]|uniref:hypothetical protein n=1 Tax=Microbacterium sp. MMO-70 TaxID=3081283 RepID=UPI0030159F00